MAREFEYQYVGRLEQDWDMEMRLRYHLTDGTRTLCRKPCGGRPKLNVLPSVADAPTIKTCYECWARSLGLTVKREAA